MYECCDQVITEKTLWYPFYTTIPSWFLYVIVEFFTHVLPSAIADVAFKLTGHKMRLLPMYRQLREFTIVTAFALLRTFIFNSTNMTAVINR